MLIDKGALFVRQNIASSLVCGITTNRHLLKGSLLNLIYFIVFCFDLENNAFPRARPDSKITENKTKE